MTLSTSQYDVPTLVHYMITIGCFMASSYAHSSHSNTQPQTHMWCISLTYIVFYCQVYVLKLEVGGNEKLVFVIFYLTFDKLFKFFNI